MKRIFARRVSIIGGLVGVFLVSSAIVAVANFGHGDRHVRIAPSSTLAVQQLARLESPTPTGSNVEPQAAPAPTVQPTEAPENEAAENEEAENEAADNEPAENEPADNEPAENDPADNHDEQSPEPAPTSAPASSTRVFSLTGGTVSVTCTGNAISLNSATPAAGFTIDSEQKDGGRVEVRFRSDSHESRLEVSCHNGTVVVEDIREEEG